VKIRLNPLILGAFIVGGVVLAVVGFLALNKSSIFGPTGHFVFYLSGSAQGLSAGTAVRLQGVRVGEVDKLRLVYDRKARKLAVAVECSTTKIVLTDTQGRHIDLTNPRTLKELISEGLVAQVQTAGLVGAKFVELGFNPSPAPAPAAGLPESQYPVVPTVPSTMAELTKDLSGVLAHLREADIPGIAQEAHAVLASVRRQVSELETNHLAAHVSDAAASLGQFMSSRELSGALEHIRAAAVGIQNLAAKLDTQVSPLVKNADTALTSANQVAQDLRDVLAQRNQLGQQTQDLLNQLDQTARSIQQLADFLERHPNALLIGRAPPTSQP
jgi:paraquat-inducible protein B